VEVRRDGNDLPFLLRAMGDKNTVFSDNGGVSSEIKTAWFAAL
jgi:hypothetical protein